jgi:acyl carrier protein phosphodiesterase
MNYLAHAYLSFQQPGLVVGNAISDFVKGKKQYEFPLPIFQGIKLHRAIDDFTDNHEATKQAKEFFRPAYRLYAGAFTDVVFDHFLAIHPLYFPTESSLAQFASSTYNILQQHYDVLPQRFQQMLPYMQQQNWLYGYRFPNGIRQSLGGLVRRSKYLEDSDTAYQILVDNYAALQECFAVLFPALVEMAQLHIAENNIDGETAM